MYASIYLSLSIYIERDIDIFWAAVLAGQAVASVAAAVDHVEGRAGHHKVVHGLPGHL